MWHMGGGGGTTPLSWGILRFSYFPLVNHGREVLVLIAIKISIANPPHQNQCKKRIPIEKEGKDKKKERENMGRGRAAAENYREQHAWCNVRTRGILLQLHLHTSIARPVNWFHTFTDSYATYSENKFLKEKVSKRLACLGRCELGDIAQAGLQLLQLHLLLCPSPQDFCLVCFYLLSHTLCLFVSLCRWKSFSNLSLSLSLPTVECFFLVSWTLKQFRKAGFCHAGGRIFFWEGTSNP